MSSNTWLGIILICLLLTCAAGCLAEDEKTNGEVIPQPTETPVEEGPDITAGGHEITARVIAGPERHFNPDRTCYSVVQIEAKNIGDEDAFNVVVHCLFIDAETGETRMKNEQFSRFNAGERKIFTLEFDTECTHSYYMEFAFDADSS